MDIRTAESTKKGGMLSNMESNFVVPQFLKILFVCQTKHRVNVRLTFETVRI